MQVLKFGGSSVANAENIERVISIVNRAVATDKSAVVCSAIGGCTDVLIEVGRLAGSGDKSYEMAIDALERRHIDVVEELFSPDLRSKIVDKVSSLFGELRDICKGVFLVGEVTHSVMDRIMSFGELLSTAIISEKLSSLGVSCRWIDSRDIFKTEWKCSQNLVNIDQTYDNIRKLVAKNNCKLYIVPGFIASDANGCVTTLGRGGSDYTASLFAAAIEARILEIWSDVDGMMTADPRIVQDAKTIRNISYKEALELSHFGAKVVYPPTIQPVIGKNIPILIKNTFNPEDPGTLIEKNPPESPNRIKGISGSGRIAILSMEGSGMVGIPGYSSRLFDVLTRSEINIILITQASSVHTMLVAIDESDAQRAKLAVDELFAYEISLGRIEPLKVEMGYSIISLVGDDMKNQSGAGGRMFEAIGGRGINIRAIAQGSSEKNVSAVVRTSDFEEAIRAIHDEFFGVSKRQINLFVAGYGNVGRKLVEMIEGQRDYFAEELNTEINIVGICNSRGMIFAGGSDGSTTAANRLSIGEIDQTLSGKGTTLFNINDFVEKITQLSYKSSIFVDCTSDLQVSMLYKHILSQKIGIVTCNKIANTLDYSYYKDIRRVAVSEDVPFMYETNVGAALPVISLLKQIKASGDRVLSIEATLSGSLNYIFNSYDTTVSFASIVKSAQEAAYTEPDPRTDLKGVDVARKALILAREIGIEAELTDVRSTSFLPEDSLTGDVADFYKSIEDNEEYFKKFYAAALSEGKKPTYCIEISEGAIDTGLRTITSGHPFYTLTGCDNAIIIKTRLYPDGIRICGAGAGAEQTASGLLSDILL